MGGAPGSAQGGEVIKAAADYLDALPEAVDIPRHHHDGIMHHAQALRKLHDALHSAHDDLMAGDPSLDDDTLDGGEVQRSLNGQRRKGQRTLSPAVASRFDSLTETMRKLGVPVSE